ncbi:MAG: glycine cleavage system aminomethyltransferase GcvT [Spirochaetales bacterium]|nr:glycine cleavage system aminomethyltransferase GcvT [Spirochaetales bacterium]
MDGLKRTVLYNEHICAGATMVDFGGWDMPVQYPQGIVAEHLYTRRFCSIFDVSHMGRLIVEGPQWLEFLQYAVTSNVAALEVGKAQYCILSDQDGCAVDDAYLYRFEAGRILLVINASNIDKDKKHLAELAKGFDCTITDISDKWAAIAVQGPESRNILGVLAGDEPLTDPAKNTLKCLKLEGMQAMIANTGYTGEPLGFEVYVRSADAERLWNRLISLGAKPAGLGARDTLRLEAALPLYGHEMGLDAAGKRMPIFAVPLARFAVNLSAEKGDFVGRKALEKQSEAAKRIKAKDYSDLEALPRRIRCIALTDRGVMRAGMEIYRDGKHIGWVTSGTMVPYYVPPFPTEETAKRSIGFCYIDSETTTDTVVEVDVRGKRLKAVIVPRHMRSVNPPFATPVIYTEK